MRNIALMILFALAAMAILSQNGTSQGMRLYGDVSMSNGSAASGHTDVWVGIYVDFDDNGYDGHELYDTDNTEGKISAVTWNATNGSYELMLDDGDPGWGRGDPYIIVVNATQWGDANGTVHALFSIVMEWTIPTEMTETEQEVDVQTRFTGFRINEFVFDDSAETDEDEWIELYNPTDHTRSIDNWIIHDNDTNNRFKFGDLPDFPSRNYVVLHYKSGTNDTFFGQSQSDALHIYVNAANKWSNAEDQICLYDSYRGIVDFVAYCADGEYNDADGDDHAAVQAGIWTDGDFVPFGAAAGSSVGLEIDGFDNDSSKDWTVFTTPSQGESNAAGTPIPEFGLASVVLAVALVMFVARRVRAERRR
ncbi:MAG: lamin tail domain-containing protein [Thermoplasmata archaeon]|nr:lamin tail domain-containing protein [Thermoplasmata archaeon]